MVPMVGGDARGIVGMATRGPIVQVGRVVAAPMIIENTGQGKRGTSVCPEVSHGSSSSPTS